MSDTQTHCSHRFIIAAASAGTTGRRKRVNWRRGVERGQEKRDEGRGERQIGHYSWPKFWPKAAVRFCSAPKANSVVSGAPVFPLRGTVHVSRLSQTVAHAACTSHSGSTGNSHIKSLWDAKDATDVQPQVISTRSGTQWYKCYTYIWNLRVSKSVWCFIIQQAAKKKGKIISLHIKSHTLGQLVLVDSSTDSEVSSSIMLR